jgi:hypothetical protein
MGTAGTFILLGLVATAVVIYGVVDAATRPDWAWERSGQNKVLWIALQAAGVLFCLFGVVMTIVYLVSIRPQVMAAQDSGGGP